jgi:GntR family transcriptional regulator
MRLLAELANKKPGERLPSEPQLAQNFRVSRPTIREVLTSLEAEGHVRRVHGVGTFVGSKRPLVPFALDLDIGVTQAVTAARLPLEIVLLNVAKTPAPGWLGDRLDLPRDATVLAIERIIKVGGVPAVRGFDAIPCHVVERAGGPTYVGGSVYRFLQEECGLELLGGVVSVTAVNTSARLATELEVPRNSALLRLDHVERATSSVPVLFSREYYVPALSSLTVSRPRQAGPEGRRFAASRGSSNVDGFGEEGIGAERGPKR